MSPRFLILVFCLFLFCFCCKYCLVSANSLFFQSGIFTDDKTDLIFFVKLNFVVVVVVVNNGRKQKK